MKKIIYAFMFIWASVMWQPANNITAQVQKTAPNTVEVKDKEMQMLFHQVNKSQDTTLTLLNKKK